MIQFSLVMLLSMHSGTQNKSVFYVAVYVKHVMGHCVHHHRDEPMRQGVGLIDRRGDYSPVTTSPLQDTSHRAGSY